ncbi:MAG TPA: copper homeostasis membrane protein CopD, partial [Stellaceae bacterium]|nr:copper homeostasis membrane protein CopD [Stellaceae bacterium]
MISLVRTLHFASLISLTGSLTFLLFILKSPDTPRFLIRMCWASLALVLASGVAWLILEAQSMSGQPLDAIFSRGVIGVVLTRTRFGWDWSARAILGVLLILCLRQKGRPFLWGTWLASLALLGTMAGAGHAAANANPLHLGADFIHLIAAGAWVGGLLPLAWALARSPQAEAAATTSRFGLMGVICVGAILVSGIVNTWYLAGTIPALIGTEYGHLLLFKIALFLVMCVIAAINRWRLTPYLSSSLSALAGLRRNALLEAGFGIGVLIVLGSLGTTPPGLHTEPWWPFSFRLDLDAPPSAMIVEAFPTSFYHAPIAFSALSIRRGAAVYDENCTQCHGASGHGDGPLAKTLQTPPADLTEPHLLAHKEGDLFWWIAEGIASSGMPGFAESLSEGQRWDAINFLRARAAGINAHDLRPTVGSSPAPLAPDFT